MDVFWLIGFGGWNAIECYSPHVVWSAASGQTVADLIRADQGLDDVERAYKERRGAAQTLIDAPDLDSAPWPPDLPRPSADRDALNDPQYRGAFDLTCLAVAFTLFHEFRHVMLDRVKARHDDRREEELACDVWAREFMTANLASYAEAHGHSFQDVLQKRSMGFALAALILHEITPVWDHGGNQEWAAGLPDDLVGVKLMREAFRPDSGPLTDKKSVGGEQVAIMELFAGAMGHCKNPPNHREVEITRISAAQLIALASHLLMQVDSL